MRHLSHKTWSVNVVLNVDQLTPKLLDGVYNVSQRQHNIKTFNFELNLFNVITLHQNRDQTCFSMH